MTLKQQLWFCQYGRTDETSAKSGKVVNFALIKVKWCLDAGSGWYVRPSVANNSRLWDFQQ